MRVHRFIVLLNEHEKALLAAIAKHLDRSQSDSIRVLVKAAAEELQLDLNPQVRENEQQERNGG